MRKDEFLSELRKKLKRLPQEETEAAIEYYRDYIDDAEGESEEAVIAEIGSPSRVAAQIYADYAVSGAKNGTAAKKGIPAVWFILLAILASPIALPVAALLLVLLLTVVVVAASLVIACFAVVFGLLVGGVAAVCGGTIVFLSSPATTVFFVGFGLFLIGLGCLLVLPCVMLAKLCFSAIARWAASLFKKTRSRNKPAIKEEMFDK